MPLASAEPAGSDVVVVIPLPLELGRRRDLAVRDLDEVPDPYPLGFLADPEAEVLVGLGVLVVVVDAHGLVESPPLFACLHCGPPRTCRNRRHQVK